MNDSGRISVSPVHPVQLWIGPDLALIEAAYGYFAEQYGVDVGSRLAQVIRERKHALIRWVAPEDGAYRAADIQALVSEAYRTRGAHERSFYVFEHAHLLNPSCANSLLKLLEEPPAHVYFILFAPAVELVLPTIASRAVVVDKQVPGDALIVPLLELFKNPQGADFAKLMKELESATLDDQSVTLFCDRLACCWHELLVAATLAGDAGQAKQAERMGQIIAFVAQRPPMPGSGKLFVRNLFLLMAASVVRDSAS